VAKILIVDDEKDIVELLSFLLEKDGHQVVPAYNGKEALAAVEMSHPDLIVLDIMMPEIDGYTVHAMLSENPATRSIPIIILTAKGQLRDLFEVASNVYALIEKPFDPKSFREKVQEALVKKSV
jgi:two-component system alkaline phosphatase synthesis response regulator PhoP